MSSVKDLHLGRGGRWWCVVCRVECGVRGILSGGKKMFFPEFSIPTKIGKGWKILYFELTYCQYNVSLNLLSL